MELEPTRIFVKVVQQSSFSRAAALLKMPVSTVSRAVSRLEAEVGTRLLQRTTRSLRLTVEGQTFFERCVGPVQTLEDARKSLEGKDSVVSGTVKITAPEDLGAYAVTPVLAALACKYPEVSFEFTYTDELVDLIQEGFDLAVRVGRLSPSRLKASRMGDIAIIGVASREYLASKPKVRVPDDLEHHDLLSFSQNTAGSRITLSSRKESVRVSSRLRVVGNQMGSLVTMATLGAGVAFVPQFSCQRELAEGRLVRVLPEWKSTIYPVSLVSPNVSEMPARVRLVADQLAISLRRMLKD